MKTIFSMLIGWALLLGAGGADAQNWPQWRGENGQGRVTGFVSPKTWPKELTEKWKVNVGQGEATPVLVGDRLYVFTRQEGYEVLQCLDAASGRELWRDKYDAPVAVGAAGRLPGSRSSPAAAGGKIVTLGLGGTLSCLDAVTGKLVWRKNDFPGTLPRCFIGSSPIIVDNLCVAQLGEAANGAIVAYDLATGSPKWKLAGDAPGYASPVVMTAGGTKLIVAQTETRMVALNAPDGTLVWEAPFPASAMAFNSSTPVVDGPILIYGGQTRGMKAVTFESSSGGVTVKSHWSNPSVSPQFNTPVVRNGRVYGISQSGEFFCLTELNGRVLWSVPGTGGRGGYGSIVDAGPVLFALTPKAQLVVFDPVDAGFKELASFKVAEKETYAYPVISGNRVFIRDRDSVTLWAFE